MADKVNLHEALASFDGHWEPRIVAMLNDYKVLVVKRILPSYGASLRFRTMFVEEAQLATRLNHPNVVQVYEFYDGGDEGQLLAMEYVEGPDLGALMSNAKAKQMRVPP